MTYAPILIGADTTLPDQRFDQALEHHRQHNLAEAGKIYREIHRETPGHVGAMHNLIDVCAHERRHLEAIPLAERLVSLFPENAETRHRLGGFMENTVWRWKHLAFCPMFPVRQQVRANPSFCYTPLRLLFVFPNKSRNRA